MDGWYRAQIVSVDTETETCEVRFLDYGGYLSLSTPCLRAVRADFLTLPFQAVECYLANVAPISEYLIFFFSFNRLGSNIRNFCALARVVLASPFTVGSFHLQQTHIILIKFVFLPDDTWCEEAKLIVQGLTYGHILQAQVFDYTPEGIPLILLYAVHGTQVCIGLQYFDYVELRKVENFHVLVVIQENNAQKSHVF